MKQKGLREIKGLFCWLEFMNKKKQERNEPKKIGVPIRVLDDVERWDTSETDPDDVWSRASTAESHDIRGIEVCGENDYHDLTVGFEVSIYQPYYLVYVIYSTGDSFGQDEGRICFVDMYETEAKAHKTVEILKNESSYSVDLKNEAGDRYTFCMPWKGYFERLQELSIKTVRRQAS